VLEVAAGAPEGEEEADGLGPRALEEKHEAEDAALSLGKGGGELGEELMGRELDGVELGGWAVEEAFEDEGDVGLDGVDDLDGATEGVIEAEEDLLAEAGGEGGPRQAEEMGDGGDADFVEGFDDVEGEVEGGDGEGIDRLADAGWRDDRERVGRESRDGAGAGEGGRDGGAGMDAAAGERDVETPQEAVLVPEKALAAGDIEEEPVGGIDCDKRGEAERPLGELAEGGEVAVGGMGVDDDAANGEKSAGIGESHVGTDTVGV
jgi:hypothetical protein